MGAAQLGACDIIQDGCHLGFYPKLKIIKQWMKLKLFDDGRGEYDVITHFGAFCQHFVLFHRKKGKKKRASFEIWLGHLLLMTAYLVTIATDSHQTLSKCV